MNDNAVCRAVPGFAGSANYYITQVMHILHLKEHQNGIIVSEVTLFVPAKQTLKQPCNKKKK